MRRAGIAAGAMLASALAGRALAAVEVVTACAAAEAVVRLDLAEAEILPVSETGCRAWLEGRSLSAGLDIAACAMVLRLFFLRGLAEPFAAQEAQVLAVLLSGADPAGCAAASRLIVPR